MQKSANDLTRELYSILHSSLITAPAGAKPTSIVALQYPGIFIPENDSESIELPEDVHIEIPNESPLENPYDPQLDEPALSQIELVVCNLVNEILEIDVVRNPTSRKLTTIYERILNANLPHDSKPMDQETLEKYNAACAYIADKKRLKAYNTFQTNYTKKSLEYQSARKKRIPRAKLLSIELEQLMNKWKANGKDEFDQNLNFKRECQTTSPASIFLSAENRYKSMEPAEQFIDFLPPDWVKDDGLSWMHMELGQTSQHTGTTTTHRQIDETITEIYQKSGFFNKIISWFKPQKAESHTTRKITDVEEVGQQMDYSNMRVSFDVAVVTVLREWFDLSLLDIQGVTLTGAPAGGISTGSLSPDNKGSMPAYISGFILAKNIKMEMEVDTKTAGYLHSVVNTDPDKAYSCGPFRLDSNAKIQESKTDNKTGSGNVTVTIDVGEKKQIIGYINTLVPKYPLK